MPSHYVLKIQYANQRVETREISAPVTVLGRESGDIVLGDQQASGRHAEIHFESGNVSVRDLGSTNGTFVNGVRSPQFALQPGQAFSIGQTIMTLMAVGGEAPARGPAKTMIAGGGMPAAPAGPPMRPPMGGPPMGGPPMGGQPMGGPPMGGQPMGGPPMGGPPMGGPPMGPGYGPPMGGPPMGGPPMGGPPMGGPPMGGPPMGGPPMGGPPMGGPPMGGPGPGPGYGPPMGAYPPPGYGPPMGGPVPGGGGTPGIAIAGLICAFFCPLIGLILSIIGLGKAKQAGAGVGVAWAGIIIAIVMMGAGLAINLANM